MFTSVLVAEEARSTKAKITIRQPTLIVRMVSTPPGLSYLEPLLQIFSSRL